MVAPTRPATVNGVFGTFAVMMTWLPLAVAVTGNDGGRLLMPWAKLAAAWAAVCAWS